MPKQSTNSIQSVTLIDQNLSSPKTPGTGKFRSSHGGPYKSTSKYSQDEKMMNQISA